MDKDAGIVKSIVQPAKCLDGVIDHGFDLVFVSDVGLEETDLLIGRIQMLERLNTSLL